MASLDGLNNNITNNINTIDGLTTLYSNGQPISSGNYVPYTGATAMVDLGSQEIKTTYAPTTGADLINKTYGDATYATQTGILAYVPYSGALGDVNLNGKGLTSGRFLVNQGSSPTASFSVDSSGNIFMPSIGTSGFLQLGTSGQVTSGYPSKLNITTTYSALTFYIPIMDGYGGLATMYSNPTFTIKPSTSTISMQNLTLSGVLAFATLPGSGTPVYTLGFDSGNNIVKYAASSSVPSQINVTITTTSADYFFPIIDSYTGVVNLFSSSNISFNPGTGVVKLPALKFLTTPTAGSSSLILALDGTGNVITTTVTTVPTQINPTLTTAATTYYPSFFSATTVGAKTVYVEGNGYLSYTPSSSGGILSVPTLFTADIYNTGAALVLEGRGVSAPINMYSTSALNFYIGTVASSTIYGNISTSGFTTTYVTAPTVKTDAILSNGATNLTITAINGGGVLIKAGVSTIAAFSVAGLDMATYPILCSTLNGLAGTISFQLASTTYLTLTYSSGVLWNATTAYQIAVGGTTYASVTSSGLSVNTIQNLSATSPLVLRCASATYPLNIYQGATICGRFSQYGLQVDTIGTLSGSSALYLNSVNNDINFQYAGTTYMTAKLANASFYQLISTTGLSLNAGGSAGSVNIASSGAGYNINFYPNGSYVGAITANGCQFTVNYNHFGNGGTTNLQSVGVEGQNGSGWIGGCFGGSGHSDRIVCGGLSGVGPTVGAHNYLLNAWATMALAYPTNVYPSDERIKEDIIDANHSMCYDTIKKLRLVRFKYKKGSQGEGFIGKDRNLTGVVAQEFEKIFPKSITDMPTPDGKDTIKSINLDQMHYTLLGCVKNLQEITETQAKEIQSLKSDLLTLHQSLTSVINILNKNKLS